MKAGIRIENAATEYWFEEGCYIAEIANDSEDELVSVARARVLPGKSTEWHMLQGVTERYIILAGKGRAEVGFDIVSDIGVGDIVRIPQGMRQRITNTGDADLEFYAICSPRFTRQSYVSLSAAGTSAA